MRVIVVNVLLTLLLTVVALVTFEISPIGDKNVQRLLYYSVNPWKKNDYRGDFFITLLPNQTIRTYARYGDEVDYDITFKTDANGFRSSGQFTSERPIISVVGDSYTMGTGGPNWVEDLSKSHADLRPFYFYNNGIGGTGHQHWKTLIDYLNREKGIDRFVVIMLELDLRREKWYSVEAEDGRISFCVGDVCTPMNIITNEKLGHLSAKQKHLRAYWKEFLLSKFPKTYAYVYAPVRRYFRREGSRFNQEKFDEFVDFLKSQEHLNFLLIKIPSKNGVRLGTNSFRLRERIRNVAYVEAECFAGLADFHVNDGHPNEKGYANLTRCVSEIIVHYIGMFRP